MVWVEVVAVDGSVYWVNPARVRYIVPLNETASRFVYDEHDWVEAEIAPADFLKRAGVMASSIQEVNDGDATGAC